MDRDLDLLAQMRQGVEYQIEVKVRAASFKFRPLTVNETAEVARKVQAAMASVKDDERNAITENTLIAKETLKLASKSDPDDKRLGDLTDALMERMTNDEIHFIMKQYVAVCDKVNPCLELMPEVEVKALVAELQKKSSDQVGLALIDLSFLEVASVCRYLIRQEPPTDK